MIWLIFAPKRADLEVILRESCWIIDDEPIFFPLNAHLKAFNHESSAYYYHDSTIEKVILQQLPSYVFHKTLKTDIFRLGSIWRSPVMKCDGVCIGILTGIIKNFHSS